MNKIQAVFESERNISHDGNSSHIIVFESGFHSGCKSRDEEITELKGCNAVLGDYINKSLFNSSDLQKEIKKLREVLEEISLFPIDYTEQDEMEESVNELIYIAQEALKDIT